MIRIFAITVAILTMTGAWAGSGLVAAQKAPVEGVAPADVATQAGRTGGPAKPVTLSGCVARQTGAGPASTPAASGSSAGVLVLTRVARPLDGPGRGAVPGT